MSDTGILQYASLIGEDGAETFFNNIYNEAYHSKIGPIAEALHKFVSPVNIEKLLLEKRKIKVLDLFFGLGYNTGVFLDVVYKCSDSPLLEIIAVEKDLEIIKRIESIQVPDWYKKWQNILTDYCRGVFPLNNIVFDLQVSCVFDSIKKLPERYFDVIFFDPFSHKTAPEFWKDNFLKSVFNLLATDGILTTYSGLKRVEALAINLGLTPKRIEPYGRKKHSLAITSLQL